MINGHTNTWKLNGWENTQLEEKSLYTSLLKVDLWIRWQRIGWLRAWRMSDWEGWWHWWYLCLCTLIKISNWWIGEHSRSWRVGCVDGVIAHFTYEPGLQNLLESVETFWDKRSYRHPTSVTTFFFHSLKWLLSMWGQHHREDHSRMTNGYIA